MARLIVGKANKSSGRCAELQHTVAAVGCVDTRATALGFGMADNDD